MCDAAPLLAVALVSAAVLGKPDPRPFLRVERVTTSLPWTLVAGYDSSNNGFNFTATAAASC